MRNLYIPNENDLRRWIKEAIEDCLRNSSINSVQAKNSEEEVLLTRKEVAEMFRVSLVTLHDWMKRGLPFHKQRGRVYFLRSEVLAYIKQKDRRRH